MDRYQQMADLQRKWTPPPELIAPGEREVRLAGAGKALAVVAVALVLGGIGVGG
jgi:hypothetical protein